MVVDIYNTRGSMLNQYWCQPIRWRQYGVPKSNPLTSQARIQIIADGGISLNNYLDATWASQKAGDSIDCVTACSGRQNKEHQRCVSMALSEENLPVAGGLPSQRLTRKTFQWHDIIMNTLQWRYNKRYGVSNHRRLDSTICSGADERKYQSSTPLAFLRWIHRWPRIPHTKGH